MYRCLDPYPAALLWCWYSFLPKEHRPHSRSEEFGARLFRHNNNFYNDNISRLQSFTNVQAPILACPPDCSYRCSGFMCCNTYAIRFTVLQHPLQGSWDLYTTQWTCGYPTRTVVSLRIRIEQLMRRDLHPQD